MAGSKKKELYVEYDLEFLEMKLRELKEYIEANPFSALADRMAYKETKGGGLIPICVANKEAQRKDLTQALKDYAEILQTVNKFREIEAQKETARGNTDLNAFETGEFDS